MILHKNGKFHVSAYYELDPDRMMHRDDEANSIASRGAVGGGVGGGIRDLEFVFDSWIEAAGAEQEFLRSGFAVQHPGACSTGVF